MTPSTLYIIGVLGGIIFMASHLFVKAGFPRPSFNPKNWVPFWKLRGKMRPPGFALMVLGLVLIWAGFIPAAVIHFFL